MIKNSTNITKRTWPNLKPLYKTQKKHTTYDVGKTGPSWIGTKCGRLKPVKSHNPFSNAISV